MIVSAGVNVYPAEVEQVFLTHPQVEDAAVIGVSDEQFGQRLKAFILPRRGTALGAEELTAWIKTMVARFQVPRDVEIVHHLPYTAAGKLDRKALK